MVAIFWRFGSDVLPASRRSHGLRAEGEAGTVETVGIPTCRAEITDAKGVRKDLQFRPNERGSWQKAGCDGDSGRGYNCPPSASGTRHSSVRPE